MIPIAQHVKNINRMRVHKDGNAFFVTFDDFVNLQESPAFFVEDEYRGHIKATFEKWYGIANPLFHLTHEERCYLSKQLTKQSD